MYEEYYNDLLSIAKILDYNESEDLVQEVYLRLYSKDNTDHVEDKKAYVMGILYNVYKEYVRLDLKFNFLRTNRLGLETLGEDSVIKSNMLERIEQVRSRDLVALYFRNAGFTTEEISSLMGIKDDSVDVMVSRAENLLLEV